MKERQGLKSIWFVAILSVFLWIVCPPVTAPGDTTVKIKEYTLESPGNRPDAQNGTSRGAKPALVIRLGETCFDPLFQQPAQKPGIPVIPAYAKEETGYYIIQFDGPVRAQWKDALQVQGAEFFDYLPDFAFTVRMPAAKEATVRALNHVRWVGIFQPAYRISTTAMGRMHAQAGKPAQSPVALRVNVFPGVDPAMIQSRIESLGGVVHGQYSTARKTTFAIAIPADRISGLTAIEGVKWIEPRPRWKLFNNVSTEILNIRIPRDDYGIYGKGQTIAVCDTGLDKGSTDPAELHDDFEDGAGNSRVLRIIDRVIEDETAVDESDTHNHGTHVAGSAVGNGSMSGSDPAADFFPATCMAGMAPKALLIFQAVEDNDTGFLSGIPEDLNELFGEAHEAGADLHTNSWGAATAGQYTAASEDVDEYMWNHKDFLILFCACNEGSDPDADGVVNSHTVGSPGTAKNAITVGASESDRASGAGVDGLYSDFWPLAFPEEPIAGDHVSDNSGGMVAFSSRGPCLDGRYKPDLVAPGTNILSTRSSMGAPGLSWGIYDDDYIWMGGTSMSTPLVAGAAALMREYLIDVKGFAIPSAALIKAALLNGAGNISPGQYGTEDGQEIPDAPVPDSVQGWGRLNLGNGIFPAPPVDIIHYDENPGLQTGENTEYRIAVNDAAVPLKINLVWTDAPGTPATQGGLVNDLDLQVTDPAAVIHYPDHASQKSTVSTISYDSGSPVGYIYGAPEFATRFSPGTFPAHIDSVSVWPYNNEPGSTMHIVVYDDDGPGGLPGTVLFSKALPYLPNFKLATVPVDGVVITGGEFYVSVQADSPSGQGIVFDRSDSDRAFAYINNRWYFFSGYSWYIRANVRSADFSTTFDRVNNTLGVTLDTPVPGIHTIRVEGYNIPQGPQPYALVVSGAVTRQSPSEK